LAFWFWQNSVLDLALAMMIWRLAAMMMAAERREGEWVSFGGFDRGAPL
jgi:hypothetical protein